MVGGTGVALTVGGLVIEFRLLVWSRPASVDAKGSTFLRSPAAARGSRRQMSPELNLRLLPMAYWLAIFTGRINNAITSKST